MNDFIEQYENITMDGTAQETSFFSESTTDIYPNLTEPSKTSENSNDISSFEMHGNSQDTTKPYRIFFRGVLAHD